MDFHEWVATGERAILDLLAREHAVTRHEIEAKLADQRVSPPIHRSPIQPHVLTHSLRQALDSARLVESSRRTRGGRLVITYTLPPSHGRRRASQDAAARKRLLQTRYNGWAIGGVGTAFAGTIGTAGEIVLQRSLLTAASNPGVPAAVAKPDVINPRIEDFFGVPVAIGPLDNAMLLLAGNAVIHVPIEIKNRRQWVYADAREVYQLLCKSARLQRDHPELNICPVLVCRRAHWTAFNMMKDLGGHVVPTNEQYVHPDIPERLVSEVRVELGYDLCQTTGSPPLLTSNFATVLPGKAPEQVTKWRRFSEPLLPYFEILRTTSGLHQRRQAFEAMLQAAESTCGISTTDKWRTATAATASN